MDFNQTQNDLDAFLDSQFSQPQQAEKPEKPEEPKSEDDDITKTYLAGDEEPQQTAQTEQLVQQTPQQPQVQQTPSESDRILQLERELAATKTRSEMYENALMQQYQPQQPQQPQVNDFVYGEDELEVEERFVNDYGDADPYISSIAKRVANDMYQKVVKPLQQELGDVRATLQNQQQFNQSQQREVLYTQLKHVVPDLEDIARSPEWQSYIRQPDAYGSTRTIASYVQEGIKSGNVRQVATIIENFKKVRQQSQPQQGQVAPGRATQTLPQTSTVRQKTLKMSEFDRATRDFQAGKLAWDKYQVIADAFNDAMMEGRVDLTK